MSSHEGYFLCMDILGFSKIVKCISHEDLHTKFESWADLVDSLAVKYRISKYSVFSDTLFVAPGPNLNDLKNLIDFSRELLSESLRMSFPLRGAISFGKYHWGKSIHGEAVLRAYELEKKQNWIGVILDYHLPEKPNFASSNLVCYAVPFRSNDDIGLYPAIYWDIPDSQTLARCLSSGGLGSPGEVLKWDWSDKYSNTILFKIYANELKKAKKDPTFFYFMHPIQLIDSVLS